MRLLKKLLKSEVISYIFFGGLTTILNFSIFFLLEKTLNSNKSFINNFIAWYFSIIFAYITANKYTFKMKFSGFKYEILKISKFIGARLFSLVLEEAGVFIFIDNLYYDKLVVKLLLGIVVIIMNYFFSKFIIFKNKKEIIL